MSDILISIGLMSGTSLDGIDAAVLKTDGDRIVKPGPSIHRPYSRDLKILIRRAVKAALESRDNATEIAEAGEAITHAHVDVVEMLLQNSELKRETIDIIGFHGQTILHRPAIDHGSIGRTWQIGDGRLLANTLRINVIDSFRSADMAVGGEGAPLAPIYHSALVGALRPVRKYPVGVVNIGGVANITYVPGTKHDEEIIAFDCGPGNGLVDEWVEYLTGQGMDVDGNFASAGNVNDEALRMMLLSPYLRRKPPKSLDRYDFKLKHVRGLTLEDGAATLTAFTAACVARSANFLPVPVGEWIICGGGRHNNALMSALRERLNAPVNSAEDVGWRGDDLEAECFGYLAVRSLKKLPLSFPMTTGAPKPVTGGTLHRAIF